jgi:hypothetical protein
LQTNPDGSNAIAWTDLGLDPVALDLSVLRAALVQPRLSRRSFRRLLVRSQAASAAGRADGPPPCRRSGLLRSARSHPRRPARLRPVLQHRPLCPKPDRHIEAVGRRDVVPRRAPRHGRRDSLSVLEGEIVGAPGPRLCRLRRAHRAFPRAARQFRERRAVGRSDERALGYPLPGVHSRAICARAAAPPKPALRSDTRRRGAVRDPRLDVLADAGALRAGQARRSVRFLLRRLPLPGRVRPRARCPARGIRAGDGASHGAMAVASADPGRRLADVDGEGRQVRADPALGSASVS